MTTNTPKPETTARPFPDALKNGATWMSPPWFNSLEQAPGDVPNEDLDRWRHYQAWTRFRAAQNDALRALNARPAGISMHQFLEAHGFTLTDVGKPETAHLVL